MPDVLRRSAAVVLVVLAAIGWPAPAHAPEEKPASPPVAPPGAAAEKPPPSGSVIGVEAIRLGMTVPEVMARMVKYESHVFTEMEPGNDRVRRLSFETWDDPSGADAFGREIHVTFHPDANGTMTAAAIFDYTVFRPPFGPNPDQTAQPYTERFGPSAAASAGAADGVRGLHWTFPPEATAPAPNANGADASVKAAACAARLVRPLARPTLLPQIEAPERTDCGVTVDLFLVPRTDERFLARSLLIVHDQRMPARGISDP